MSRSSDTASDLLAALLLQYDGLKDRLRRRFGDREFAADVMQDLCVSVLESTSSADIRQPHAFLAHAATHLAIDQYRSNASRSRTLNHLAACPSPHRSLDTPETIAISNQVGEALLVAIQALPIRCQETFILVKLHHMPQADAARALGISRGMVARHMARAMDALHPLLDIHCTSDHAPRP